ncbi:MAG: lipopolysaccharide transport periplasmic protein LptA [Chromatiaceae bacterium]|jgi:lipopolysaccharide export system protein LptA|nr:lipopolysaccharide transport periplasmic protein LptA [Chromatiaceae bacterium]
MKTLTSIRALAGLAALCLMPVLLLAPLRLPALEEDQEQPLYLESDSAEIFEAKSLSIYTGNVFVKQGSMELRGDQVTVHHDPERRPEFIITIGAPATYLQQVEGEEKKVEAEALRMEFDRDKDEITLINQAVLFQGEDTFRSDRIVYDRAKAQVKAGTIADGKERVKIVISPSRQ